MAGEIMKRMKEILGIVDEGEIVSEQDLEGKEEYPVCQEPTKLSWDKDGN